jgi:hypothetical protein
MRAATEPEAYALAVRLGENDIQFGLDGGRHRARLMASSAKWKEGQGKSDALPTTIAAVRDVWRHLPHVP